MKMSSVVVAAILCSACGPAEGDDVSDESVIAPPVEAETSEAQAADTATDCVDSEPCSSLRTTFARGPEGRGTVYK